MLILTLTIIGIIVLVSIPFSIINYRFMMKAHYRVEGRWYGQEFEFSEKIYSTLPFCSIAVFAIIILHFGSCIDGWKSDGLRG